jgi:Na+-transporting NADH:ubiquinone oxidoreductase subunit C
MFVITVVFVGVLALLFHSTDAKIEHNRLVSTHNLLISLFADTLSTVTKIPKQTLLEPASTEKIYHTYFQEIQKPLPHMQVVANNKVLGYVFDITGSGLWGTMQGFVGLTPDLKKIVNFVIYQQVETPGLGARISEMWFRNQFAGKTLEENGKFAPYTLVPEGAKAGPDEIRQITGATITSSSVIKMLQKEMQRIIPTFEASRTTLK